MCYEKEVDSMLNVEGANLGRNDMSGEQSLWMAVIRQAFLDALKVPQKVKTLGTLQIINNDTLSATDFLEGNSKGFRNVCAFAGLDPEWVTYKFQQIKKNNLQEKDMNRIGDKSMVHKHLTKNP